MQFQVQVTAGDRVISSATVSDLDPSTDAAQMLRSALQLHRDRSTGQLRDVPELVLTITPITQE